MRKRIIMFSLGLIGVALLIWAMISFSRQSQPTPGPHLPVADLPFQFSFQNLQPTTSGVYELWLVRGDNAWSFGRFKTSSDGQDFAQDTKLRDIAVKPQDGDQIMVTIELSQEMDDQPTDVVVLSGFIGREDDSAFGSGIARLSYPIDLSAVSGSYILGTPTNDPEAYETAGIWFTTPTGSAPTLSLPDLVDGWIYQLWVEHQGVLLSGGRFEAADQADQFDGHSGKSPGPNYPGEDYLNDLPSPFSEPIDLADGTSRTFISLEPDLDGFDPSDLPSGASPERFITFLSANIPRQAQDHTSYYLERPQLDLPSATFKLID